jgi:hypothetical protein
MKSKEELDNFKLEAISSLKKEWEEALLESFVEKTHEWRTKLNAVNSVINQVDSYVSPYSYDEFCKKIIEVSKKIVDKEINYNDLFLKNIEYSKIKKEKKFDKNIDEAIVSKLNEKFINHFTSVLDKKQILEAVRYKLKEKYYLIEGELQKSMKKAELILKQKNSIY